MPGTRAPARIASSVAVRQACLRPRCKEFRFLGDDLIFFIKELFMKSLRFGFLGLLTAALLGAGFAQQAAQHMLSADEIRKMTPTEYFFRGQKAPVQVRNSTGANRARGPGVLRARGDRAG